MDPNSNQTIDPKLKEAYDRVMNTQVPPPNSIAPQPNDPIGGQNQQPSVQPAPSAAAPSTFQPAASPAEQPTPAPTAPTFTPPPPPITQPIPEPQVPTSPQPTEPAMTTVHATIPLATKPAGSAVIVGASPKKGNGKLFLLFFAIAGLIFFGVYTIFWIKFFNLSIPFLPF